jgi:alanine racemase
VTEVLIDRSALISNYRLLAGIAGPATEVAAVVKADAYGHGLTTASRAFREAGCRTFCIATTEEAADLRETLGWEIKILKLLPSLPNEFAAITDIGVEQVIASVEDLKAWEAWLSPRRRRLAVHLKIDRGMGRLGFNYSDFNEAQARMMASPYLKWVGLMSHLPSSEEDPTPREGACNGQPYHTAREVGRFREIAEEVSRTTGATFVRHIGNSAAALFYPESRFDLVRAGLALYGADPRGKDAASLDLLPAMSLQSRIVQTRTFEPGATIGYGRGFEVTQKMRVGVLPVGYADGLFRKVAERGCVLVQGKRCRILGRVSMNLITIDLSEVQNAGWGDPVVLLGRQGGVRITVEEMASWAETIPYEIMTSVGRLAPRRAVENAGDSSGPPLPRGLPEENPQP